MHLTGIHLHLNQAKQDNSWHPCNSMLVSFLTALNLLLAFFCGTKATPTSQSKK